MPGITQIFLKTAYVALQNYINGGNIIIIIIIPVSVFEIIQVNQN